MWTQIDSDRFFSTLVVMSIYGEVMELKKVLNGTYEDWRGLTASLAVADLEKDLEPITAREAPKEIERMHRRFFVARYERALAPHEVNAWSEVGQEGINILEYADPPVTDLERTLEHYGTPELLLVDQRFATGARVWDYVYASRGITFSIAEPYPPAPQFPRRAVYVQLYPAISIESYVTDVGAGVSTSPKVWPS